MAESAVSAFEQIKHTDEQGEFWLARELGKLLGYDKWQNFLGVIHEAMEVCRVQGGSTEGVFTAIGKNPTKRGGRPSAEYDYRLSRHACYLVAESADGRKEEVALAKIYFALTTERYELLAQTEEERLRIEHRQRLLRENADLALRAREAGAMTSQEFAAFFNAGYRGLYHETQQQIRERKGLKRGQDISDYMGSLETAANIFRAALARQLMDDRGVAELPRANATHHEAGDSVRAVLLSRASCRSNSLHRGRASSSSSERRRHANAFWPKSGLAYGAMPRTPNSTAVVKKAGIRCWWVVLDLNQ